MNNKSAKNCSKLKSLMSRYAALTARYSSTVALLNSNLSTATKENHEILRHQSCRIYELCRKSQRDVEEHRTAHGFCEARKRTTLGRPLTLRQEEILRLMADGLTAKEIAYRTQLSPKTIEFHKGVIYDKLGVRTTAAVVRHAFRSGLIAESEVRPQAKVFRVVFYSDELERLSLAFVSAPDEGEAEKKLRAGLPHLRDLKVTALAVAEGLFILD